jgi:hypothetical protein
MSDVVTEHEPDESREPIESAPSPPPYAPDPQLFDLMERGRRMSDEEVRDLYRRYAGNDRRNRASFERR